MKTVSFLAALLLAGCGGGGGGDSAGAATAGVAMPSTAPVAAPVTMADAFFSSVQGLLGGDADGEPVAVDGVATPAEGQEPQALN
ncbi:hypothetical protein GJV26_17425 [Massilia dura]|uniref:Uncharacterized protein n=1 Tax=Pseudoduganella dura TaxID=321982 RepID=A0A6I3XF90_9BURK|nr:hypothetical protein [Pseudoduganella dura]MUI14226.1 hypothetical protein [Pseudoduganella dura]GGX76387.1 hypothetical protein GCM10007386_04160 [Pseudoduganella dura]